MRTDEISDLYRKIHNIQRELDDLLTPDVLPYVHSDVKDIALRCREALMKEAA